MMSSDTKSDTKEVCCACRLPRAQHECEVCYEPICRTCLQRVDEATFMFQPKLPEILTHNVYCQLCYDEHVAPRLETYNEVLTRAKEVFFITLSFRGFLPTLKKAKTEISVKDCTDRDETIMRLAFLAAEAGYNSIIYGEVTSQKVRDNAYQTSRWSGHGLPAIVDEAKLRMDEMREEVWRRGR